MKAFKISGYNGIDRSCCTVQNNIIFTPAFISYTNSFARNKLIKSLANSSDEQPYKMLLKSTVI